MRWLKRGLWMAAWGCWVWLGVGLYRELPREKGDLLHRVEFRPNERIIGFWKDSHQLVISDEAFRRFRSVDAANAMSLGILESDHIVNLAWSTAFFRRRDRDFSNWINEWSFNKLSTPTPWEVLKIVDASTENLLYREWDRTERGTYLEESDGADDNHHGFVSLDRQYSAAPNGKIFGPPRITWILLALCQTILALPLILLWMILRWRRSRRLRMSEGRP